MTCEEVRGLLEEYFDGELQGDRRDAVRAHVGSCGSCAAELSSLEKLEGLLMRSAAQPDVATEEYVRRVSTRVRREGLWLRRAAAAAAVLLVSLTVWNLVPLAESPTAEQLHARLAQYAAAEGAEKERISGEFHAMGEDVVPRVVRALEHPSVRVQIGAAQLLGTYRNETVQELLAEVAARRPAQGEGWALDDIGMDDSDRELIDVAFDLVQQDGRQDQGMEVLRRVDFNGFDREAHNRIVDRLIALLKNKDPEVQKLALELVRELGIEFPVPRLVELFDVPELRKEALEVLRQATGKDFGYDKDAWRKYWASKAGV